jgi:hypothetical protein
MNGYRGLILDRLGFSGKTNRRRGEPGSLGKPRCAATRQKASIWL